MSREQIEEMACEECLHYLACRVNSEYVPTPCRAYENKADYRKQEWISVDERLPEEDGWYITYTNANGKSRGVLTQQLVTTTIRGTKTRRWEWQTRVSPWTVTHWMPLPEPPKMKGGAE